MRVNGRIISWRNNREGENENPVSRRIYRYHKYPVTKFSLAFQFSPNTIRKLSGQWIDPYIRTYVHTHSCILQRALQNLHLLEIPKISLFQIYIITRLTSFLETMKDIRVSHKFLTHQEWLWTKLFSYADLSISHLWHQFQSSYQSSFKVRFSFKSFFQYE